MSKGFRRRSLKASTKQPRTHARPARSSKSVLKDLDAPEKVRVPLYRVAAGAKRPPTARKSSGTALKSGHAPQAQPHSRASFRASQLRRTEHGH